MKSCDNCKHQMCWKRRDFDKFLAGKHIYLGVELLILEKGLHEWLGGVCPDYEPEKTTDTP